MNLTIINKKYVKHMIIRHQKISLISQRIEIISLEMKAKRMRTNNTSNYPSAHIDGDTYVKSLEIKRDFSKECRPYS